MKHSDGQIRDAVYRSVERTFADMAFIDAVAVESPDEAIQSGQLVHIEFAEPMRGHMTLHLSTGLKRLVVENIVGRSWADVNTEAFDDCLLELLNVLAGNFLSELGESEKQYSITLPQLLFDEKESGDGSEKLVFHFNAEDNPLQVSVSHAHRSQEEM